MRKLILAALLVGSAVLWLFLRHEKITCAEHLRVNPCRARPSGWGETQGILHKEAGQLHCSPACDEASEWEEYSGWCWRRLDGGECRFEMSIQLKYTPPAEPPVHTPTPLVEHICLRDVPELRCTFPVDDRPGRKRSDGVCRPVCADSAETECWTEHSVPDTKICAYLAQK